MLLKLNTENEGCLKINNLLVYCRDFFLLFFCQERVVVGEVDDRRTPFLCVPN